MVTRAPAPTRAARIAVGSDIRHETADAVVRHLEAVGITVVSLGAVGGSDTPWPEVAELVARLVAVRSVDQGVVCCWTGTGVSMAANKVTGIRAALCTDIDTAMGARRWNDANVLALSLARTDPAEARAILDAWLSVDCSDADEAVNIERLSELERRYGTAAARGRGG
ncbi:MAG: RpiB/LacA/LacB family sugar-phosphate isomerase [Candidatus Dormibacteria bacterium]